MGLFLTATLPYHKRRRCPAVNVESKTECSVTVSEPDVLPKLFTDVTKNNSLGAHSNNSNLR